MNARKKTKRKSPSKARKAKPGTPQKPNRETPSTAKDKEELIRIWDEDLCE